MGTDRVAFNLLIQKTCERCDKIKGSDDGLCLRFLGESVGWQWIETSNENTCEDWVERKIKYIYR